MTKVNAAACSSKNKHCQTSPNMLSCRPSKSLQLCKQVKAKSWKKKEWDQVSCSVCLEYPHNAVLLLCSSHDKGCRPYMCSTGRRYSNCLEQYKKAYMKLNEMHSNNGNIVRNSGNPVDKVQVPELLCPLCRGQVKGCTVLETARKYFNGKKRVCVQEKCTFAGKYKELRKHVRTEHPWARPRAVDPALEEKWKMLEQQRERNDVISTIISSTPGAVVLGDYVIERNPIYMDYDLDSDGYSSDDLFPLDNLGREYASSALVYDDSYDLTEEEANDFMRRSSRFVLAAPSRAISRHISGRLNRRRRR